MAKKETPLMKQYNSIKGKYPDALLLFRVGDFYETFGQDAVKAAKVLDIVLTKRANGSASHIELAGFPHHALDTYLPKLVRAGYRVAICDQLEDPSKTKKIVKRGVTELVTPGVALNDQVLATSSNNWLMAIHVEKEKYGAALLDISTGEFWVSEGKEDSIQKLIQNFSPKEIIYQKRVKNTISTKGISTFALDDWAFSYDFGYEKLTKLFQTKSLKGFGVQNLTSGIAAAGAVLAYLDETHHHDLQHITKIQQIVHQDFVWMDAFTVRNLEIFSTPFHNGISLLQTIDHTCTPMGKRLLKRWLALPLSRLEQVQHRHQSVEYFLKNEKIAQQLTELLKDIPDVERLCSKIATLRISPKQLAQLTLFLDLSDQVAEILKNYDAEKINALPLKLKPIASIKEKLTKTLSEDPPHFIPKGNVIATGISEELDELRDILKNGKNYLKELCERETERTGITSLKINFNNVFGYYLEVRNTHKDKVPEEWQRKQTLVNSERYITPELKTYEQKILGAEEKILHLEKTLFEELVTEIMPHIPQLQQNAHQLAQLDNLLGFAHLAERYQYVKPQMNEGFGLHIEDGRHPVIEQQLPPDKPYIPNSVFADTEEQQILMITGPNMSGKSALLRQTALIVLLAQIGSYVPAKSADIGLVDKIFTRVGASDNLSQGESTFMVEMNETAQILNSLTGRSLIILDEIGRGTSTYDGISIAWAIAEFLHNHPYKPKTLFATHYHELNEMANSFERIANFNVSIKETKDTILFLRKLQPGGSEHSFGIHVAKLAGMPRSLISRANEILGQLETSHGGDALSQKTQRLSHEEMQLSFFQLDDPILESLREEIETTDINTLTPVEALMKLNEIKKKLGR